MGTSEAISKTSVGSIVPKVTSVMPQERDTVTVVSAKSGFALPKDMLVQAEE